MASYPGLAKLKSRLTALREGGAISSEQDSLLDELDQLASEGDFGNYFIRMGSILRKSILGPASDRCSCCGRTL